MDRCRYQEACWTTRISVAEMERYYHLLGVCQETAVLQSMYEPLERLRLSSSDMSAGVREEASFPPHTHLGVRSILPGSGARRALTLRLAFFGHSCVHRGTVSAAACGDRSALNMCLHVAALRAPIKIFTRMIYVRGGYYQQILSLDILQLSSRADVFFLRSDRKLPVP